MIMQVGEEFDVQIEKGKTLGIKTLAMAEDLTPSGEREVFFEMNGQMRSVLIRDKEAVKVINKCPKLCTRNICYLDYDISYIK